MAAFVIAIGVGIVVGVASAALIPGRGEGWEDLIRVAVGVQFGLVGLVIAYGVLAPVLLRKVLPGGRRALPIACALLVPLVLLLVGFFGYKLTPVIFDIAPVFPLVLLLWLLLTPALVALVVTVGSRKPREGASSL